MALTAKAAPKASTSGSDSLPDSKDIKATVAALVDALGPEVTALVAGAAHPKTVQRWAQGAESPPLPVQRRLCTAWTVMDLITAVEPGRGLRGLRAWFLGANPYLDGLPPAAALGTDPAGVIAAAQTFVAHG